MKNFITIALRSITALSPLILVPHSLNADQLAVTPTADILIAAPIETTATVAGFRFEVTSPIRVSGLAYWDNGSNGLNAAHDVTLWMDNGAMLSTASVASGSPLAGPEFRGGRFRVEPVDLTLAAGVYRIGGTLPAVDDMLMQNPLQTIPPPSIAEVKYLSRAAADVSTFPATLIPFGEIMGASFFVVPEPQSLGLLVIATSVAATRIRGRG